MMTEQERYDYLLARRSQLEKDMHDAEILFGLLRKTLSYVDEQIKQISIDLQQPVTFKHAGIHINAKRTTIEERLRIVELYQEGKSLTELSTMFNLSKTTVIRILKKEHVVFHTSFQKKNPDGYSARQDRVLRSKN